MKIQIPRLPSKQFIWLSTGISCFLFSLSLKAEESSLVRMIQSPHAGLKGVGLNEVHWTQGFWAERYKQTHDVTLRRLWELAEDPKAGHVLENMRIAAGTGEGKFTGTTWQDAWLYKWIEAAACIYKETGDGWIDARMDEAIELIARAQEDDGYIATQITATGKPRFQDPRNHEVYNMGHLLTAACIHKRMTGKDSLMRVAIRCADFLSETLGVSVSPAYAHNPSAIMGLVELYRETGNGDYLDCARRIVDGRGAHPKPGSVFHRGAGIEGTDQIQDRTPLRRATEVVGHNVFFTYLYAGAADVYLETGDKTLMEPLERLWVDLTKRKMSINGGVSPMGRGLSIKGDPVVEAVGAAYYLPSADSYNETCGQIGNFMWNYRMLSISKDSRYADTMELELYNGFLGGIGLDGESWFYRNALRRYDVNHVEAGHNNLAQRGLPGRNRICCPTNLLRTFAELQGYIYSTGDGGFWVHHYGGNVFEGKLMDGNTLKLTQKTNYPWDGNITLELNRVDSIEPFSIRMRIPAWARGAVASVNGKAVEKLPISGTYFALKRAWKAGDVIVLDLPMQPRLVQAHPKVEQLRNQVAVMRGPMLYTLESFDLGETIDLNNVYLPSDIKLTLVSASDLPFGVRVLEGEALYRAETPWKNDLYRPLTQSVLKPLPIRMIPYFAWNNRGSTAMSVWLPIVLKD